MEYINYLSDIVGMDSKERKIPYRMTENNKMLNFLKSKGYKFIYFSSAWIGPNRYADVDIRCDRSNEFLMVLIETTMLRPFGKYLIDYDIRRTVLCSFSKLAEIHRIEGPKFVFAHILPPHSPYIFGANGEVVPKTKLEMEETVQRQKELYLDQLIFVNKRVEILVNEILLNSKIPPVIILQADHGPDLTFGEPNNDGWDHPNKNMLRERMRIFNAYYLPQGGNNLLYKSITPVNTFRLIFNFYFNTNYELLNDQSYYSTYEYPYRFIKIGNKIFD